jgi:nitroreductase
MKTIFSFLIFCFLAIGQIKGQSSGSPVTDAILSGYSVQKYNTVPVTDKQLDIILNCGIKAPSAMNNQPWKFTVIKDESTMKEIISAAVAGNVLIIISGVESEKDGSTPAFDCGLTTQSMFIAAEGLGLGARIYGSPVSKVALNRKAYEIPAGYKPVIVLRIGNIDKSVDAVSAASARKSSVDVVNFKK